MIEPVRIGITMGDPAGVGAEIIAKTICRGRIKKIGKVLVIGDRWVFNKIKNKGLRIKNDQFMDLNNVPRKNFRFGKVKREFGQAAIEYLRAAVELIKIRRIDCLVTAPISKEAINLAGYKYNGHTEFLARTFGKGKQDLVMMLLNKYLKISLVTRHLALSKVSPTLTQQAIFNTIMITQKALGEYFSINNPSICVTALNPHAGDGGILGNEETKIILPAVQRARRLIKDVIGPLPADTAFSAAKQGRFSAVIAMYHDQALIPLKTLDSRSGVNLTIGLGFVRTSPLHGTGFDIAGKNVASNASLIAAINTAVKCSVNLRKASLNKIKR